ncbi:MAG TPA: hypothetical protein VF418_12765 [Sphingomonadaceae bacterium]
MSFIKAMILGAILTGVVSLIVGSQGSDGGLLSIFPVDVHAAKLHFEQVHNFTFYWSWPLFLAGSGLAWAIILMLD